MVVARGDPGTSSLLLPYSSSSVPRARRSLSDDLAAAGVRPPALEDALLVLSELVSNAIQHARPLVGDRVRVSWRVFEDELHLEVTDGGGPTAPRPGRAGSGDIGGRGLYIVSALTACWGVRDVPGGSQVWAILRVRGRHARRDRIPS